MITFLRLGSKGNLGNHMFQIASTIGLSLKHNHEFAFPSWQYSDYFQKPLPVLEIKKSDFETLIEQNFNFHEWPIGKGNYNLQGWLQSEKYFIVIATKRYFTFKEELVSRLRTKHSKLLDDNAILITVRRGDFVNHPRFYQLNYKYYLLALFHNFPDWEERKLVFTSDNIDYCKRYFNFLPNAHFLKDLSPIEQLILGSQFNHFIISNSTFSWWMAWLGEKDFSKIIRPKKNFRGKHAIENNDKDFFPERWVIFDHHKYTVPIKYYILIIRGGLEDTRLWLFFQIKILKIFIRKSIKI